MRTRRFRHAALRTRATPVAAGSLLALALLSGCGGTSTPSDSTSSQSATRSSQSSALVPVGSGAASRQLEWVVTALNRGSNPGAAEIAKHFSPAFLKVVSPTQLVAALTPLARQGLTVAGAFSREGDLELAAELTGYGGVRFRATISVAPVSPNLIEGLLFTPIAGALGSWSAVDAALERLAPHASLYAGHAGGGEVHALNATAPGAIGSAFKLYVLGALANAVAHGSLHWTSELAIRNSWKSLPSGNMRLEPAGTRFTLLHYAQQMISLSDNTAADHLIGLLGRGAVEAQLAALGNRHAALDLPFLTTRELFALKLAAPASLATEYASAGSAERTRLLAQVDRLTPTLAQAAHWTTPREISKIEWFASPADLARAIAALVDEGSRPGLAPLRQILSINPGIAFDHATWPYVAYKGGSEPGVLSTTWYLRRSDGRAFVLSIVLNDPAQAISTLAEVEVAQAAAELLAKA
jgi:beta-lactamase class A